MARLTVDRRSLSRQIVRATETNPSPKSDLDFNRHLRHNLAVWAPLVDCGGDVPFFGSIYNTDRPAVWRPANQRYFIVPPAQMWGAQAVLVSRATANYFLAHWAEEHGAADLRMPRLGARLAPVYLHVPSLVQHVGDESTWGGPFHTASDFDRDWRAPEPQRNAMKKCEVLSGS